MPVSPLAVNRRILGLHRVGVLVAHFPGLEFAQQKIGRHVSFALNFDRPTALEPVLILEQLVDILRDLTVIGLAGRLHPGSDIDCVTPNVVLWLPCPDYAGHDGTDVDADAEQEIIVGVFVDIVETFLHRKVQVS